MIIEIKVPSPGESITEVEITQWFVENGDFVEKDQEIAEIESDKATLSLSATAEGEIRILKETGIPVAVGDVVCEIDTAKKGKVQPKKKPEKVEKTEEKIIPEKILPVEEKKSETPKEQVMAAETIGSIKITPVARQMMEENKLSVEEIIKGLKKISSKEVNAVINSSSFRLVSPETNRPVTREEKRNRMSMLRRKLSQRLVSVKNETALLTTFNEADMTKIMELRKKFQEEFLKKYNVKLGFMSFFTKAITEALKAFPIVNSRIEGDEIVTPEYADIGIAVQTTKGLMVPILRNAETMGMAEIEQKIIEIADKARNNKLSIEEMTGGTFTITNGGIYGSMLSTPIINSPQSAILGMHNIIERPVAINGQVVIRPMMYLALSYDHRVIDGRDSVSFLVKVKEYIEDPEKLLFNGADPSKMLLGI